MNSMRWQSLSALIGRIMLSSIFLISACAKVAEWSGTVHMMEAKGIAMAPLFLSAATAVELIAGTFVLVGFYSRYAALILFLYMIPVTVIFHNFWAAGPAQQAAQTVTFLKNVAIMGGLFGICAHGAGRYSYWTDNEPAEDEFTRSQPRTRTTTAGR